jgi:hypothetical protein
MVTIGMLLTFCGAAVTLIALRLLSGECCPRCGVAGSLTTTHYAVEESPGVSLLLRRCRQCDECEAIVEDIQELGDSPHLPSIGRRLAGTIGR